MTVKSVGITGKDAHCHNNGEGRSRSNWLTKETRKMAVLMVCTCLCVHLVIYIKFAGKRSLNWKLIHLLAVM